MHVRHKDVWLNWMTLLQPNHHSWRTYSTFEKKDIGFAVMPTTAYSEVPAHEQQVYRGQECDEFQDERLTTDGPSEPIEIDNEVDSSTSQGDEFENGDRIYFVDEAIERLGMGRFQMIVLAAAGLCFAADGMQVLQLTFLSEVLRSQWDLNDEETAFITSILFIGAIFGTLTLGPLADKKGRKPVFLLASSIISVFGVAVATVSSYRALLANLFMVGWGVGGLTGELVVLHCLFFGCFASDIIR